MALRERKLKQFVGYIEGVKLSEQTRTLKAVQQWGESYLEWDGDIAVETDAEILERFLKILRGFIESLESKWMGKRLIQLRRKNQKLLRELLQERGRLERDIMYRILDIERDKILLKEMESLAFPEPTELVRDYSGWLRSPFYYSQDLLDAARELPVP